VSHLGGRDPQRAGTPREILFDLTFATSFGLVAIEITLHV
jgi:hypothetical protein